MAAVRPDIQFAVKELSRKLSSPTSKDESAAKHLIRYLRGTQNLVFRIAHRQLGDQVSALNFMPTVTQIGQVVQSAESQQLWGSSIVHYSRTQATSVIIEMGIAKSTEGIKLHVHTDSASGKAMVSKLG
eukprot:2084258-Amphidinium_carterae.1